MPVLALPTTRARLRSASVVVAGGGGSVPSDVSGLALWLKADALSLANNDPVDTWTDSSGNGRSATAGGGVRPLYKTNIVNGKPVVRFDGSDDRLVISAFSVGSSAITVYSVVNASTDGTTQTIIQQGDPWYATDGGWVQYIAPANTFGFGHTGNVGIVDSKSVNTVTGSFKVLHTLYNYALATNEVTAWVNGVADVAAYSNNSNNTGSFGSLSVGIGSTPGAGVNLHGDIAEIAVWNRSLTGPEITAMDAYFATKYGL